MDITWIDFTKFEDERGCLVAVEAERSIPFEIQRVYYISGVQPDVHRGFHAHKQTRQILVCISGSCIFLLDNGKEKEYVELNRPNRGLLVDRHIWHEMFQFTPGTILMSLASEWYNEDDYIRNYETFLKYVQEK